METGRTEKTYEPIYENKKKLNSKCSNAKCSNAKCSNAKCSNAKNKIDFS